MSESTGIPWCHHAFNGVWGCVEVSPECAHCYAREWAARWGWRWGRDAPRRTFDGKHWAEPRAWDRKASRVGERHRVFAYSMGDFAEDNTTTERETRKLWPLVEETPNLDWLLLTKRPERLAEIAPDSWGGSWPRNAWALTTVGVNCIADRRMRALIDVPAAIRGVSMEPLLEYVDISHWLATGRIHWVIVGGESGRDARPFDVGWARMIRDQCDHYGVAFFMKQFGSRPVGQLWPGPIDAASPPPWQPIDRKGEDPAEWPGDLRIREYPRSPCAAMTSGGMLF